MTRTPCLVASAWSFHVSVVLVIVLSAGVAGAQVVADPVAGGTNLPTILIEPTAPVTHLFHRASEGAALNDMKLAVDSLQRIIDDPQDSLVELPQRRQKFGRRYVSARRAACAQLVAIAPGCLETYRLLHDGKAKRLFEQALATHDEAVLRRVVSRYLLTSYGDDAADTLASWALDAGRPGEALRVLTRATELIPDADVPATFAQTKMAAAYLMQGQQARARAVLNIPSTAGQGPHEARPWADALFDNVSPLRPTPPTVDDGWWPVRGGGPDRRGCMAGVDPTLTRLEPWRFYLGGSPTVPRMLWEDTVDTNDVPVPAGQLVSDGIRLFTRTPTGCTALSLTDLTHVWSSTIGRDDVSHTPLATRQAVGAHEAMRAPMTKSLQSAIGIACGLVFTLEPDDAFSFSDTSDTTELRQAIRRSAMYRSVSGDGRPLMSLVARTPDTGALVWRAGHRSPGSDMPGNASFRSVPLEINGTLWTAYTDDRSLNIAVLAPATGQLLRSIPLGTLPSLWPETMPEFLLSLSEDVVYAATPAGSVFAIDARDGTAIWAHLSIDPRGDDAGPTAWPAAVIPALAASPLLVAGGMVVVSPMGMDGVYALAAHNGEMSWVMHLGPMPHVVGVIEESLIVADLDKITCLNLADGAMIWQSPHDHAPTGRAVLCKDAIVMPTLGGLTRLDARTGSVMSKQSRGGQQPPLGNLLAVAGALYSVDDAHVRRFPDFAALSAMGLQAGCDFDARIQLGWLALMQDDAQAAWEQVTIDATTSALLSAQQLASLADVRIEAAVRLAPRLVGEGHVADAIDLLREAEAGVSREAARLRCIIALVDVLRLAKRDVDAFRALRDLALSPSAQTMVPWSSGRTGRAFYELTPQFTALAANLDPQSAKVCREETDALVTARLADLRLTDRCENAYAQLLAAAELPWPDVVRQRACLGLGRWLEERRKYEQAEQFLMRAADMDDRSLACSARMQLCQMYAEPDQMLYQGLLGQLDALSAQYEQDAIPPDAERSNLKAPTTIGQWAKAYRRAITSTDSSPGFAPASTAPPSLSGRQSWLLPGQRGHTRPRLVSIDDPTAPAMIDRVLTLLDLRNAAAVDALTGELLWQSQLRLPGILPDTRADEETTAVNKPRALCQGQTLLIDGPDGLYAVGAVTGRRLWALPYNGLKDRPSTPMAACHGRVAVLARGDELIMADVVSGRHRWTRRLADPSIDTLWMDQDRLLAVNGHHERVDIYDPQTGAQRRTIVFRQRDAKHARVDLVCAGRLCIGPMAEPTGDHIACVDLFTGDTLWTLSLPRPIERLFVPDDGMVGVGLMGGMIHVISTSTGQRLLEAKAETNGTCHDGTLTSDTLLLQHLTTAYGQSYPQYTAIDTTSGQTIWQRDVSPPIRRIRQPLSVLDGAVLIAVEQGSRSPHQRTGIAFELVDLRTGRRLGALANCIPAGTPLSAATGEARLWPDALVVETSSSVEALEIVDLLATADGATTP